MHVFHAYLLRIYSVSNQTSRFHALLSDLSLRELDELQAALTERRAHRVYEDRKRVRELVIAAAHAEGFALSELFDLGRRS